MCADASFYARGYKEIFGIVELSRAHPSDAAIILAIRRELATQAVVKKAMLTPRHLMNSFSVRAGRSYLWKAARPDSVWKSDVYHLAMQSRQLLGPGQFPCLW